MSRVVCRDTLNTLLRSNSDDNISSDPMLKILHSKPTSRGATTTDYNTQDDNISVVTLRDTVASSPFENASSALAVLDILPLTFNLIHGYLPEEQKRLKKMSIPERQPTISSTKDLLLPFTFLPGEEDVKIKEEITYRDHKDKVVYRGKLIVTKYRLLFVRESSGRMEILVDVPLGMISQIEKIGGQTRSNISDGADYGIEINCKDLRHFFFGNAKEQNQRRNLYDNLTRLIFPFTISRADFTNPLQFFSSFFAWNFKNKISPNEIDPGWTLYNGVKDYIRMGIRRHNDQRWRINTEINKNYELCDTYPNVLVHPSNIDHSKLQSVAAFRSRNRIPVLSWFSKKTGVSITRASQPLTGLNHKSQDDVDYLHAIGDREKGLFILDARPKINALANKANGGGYEDYPNCELEFQNIHNIHVMRESLNKLHLAVRNGSQEDKSGSNDFTNSNWLSHIRTILTCAYRLVSIIHNDERSVLVHCSDGWDRTAQLTSLAMIILDGYYRTLEGFIILIEKEWISFGHKFLLRIGHGDKNYSERSPVFLQFLDCTYQLLRQCESSFEFNERFLLTICDYLYSCQFGTFLLNSEKLRYDMKIDQHTMSAWTPILYDRESYINPSYNEKFNTIIQINVSPNQIKLWKNYYCRYMTDYQPTVDLVKTQLTNTFISENQSNDESSSEQLPVSYRILPDTLYGSIETAL